MEDGKSGPRSEHPSQDICAHVTPRVDLNSILSVRIFTPQAHVFRRCFTEFSESPLSMHEGTLFRLPLCALTFSSSDPPMPTPTALLLGRQIADVLICLITCVVSLSISVDVTTRRVNEVQGSVLGREAANRLDMNSFGWWCNGCFSRRWEAL